MIRVLDKETADKIAAGEVVERPVSIVKELLENSVDAGATSITVEIKGGGRDLIRVTDDGCGIPSEEVETAFLRHATSKIRTVSDLNELDTLGFRGEALASIAAVSNLEMITRTEDEKAGKRIVIRGGETILSEAVGALRGTTVTVTVLFYNVPARAAFLKSEGAEAGRIIDLCSRIAVAGADKRFRLISNDRPVFSTPGSGNLLAAIVAVYKDREYRNLIRVDHAAGDVRVLGYISRPTVNRSNRRDQYFYVNGRTVNSPLLERALSSAYKERMFEGRHPVAFLFVNVPPGRLDVNIHPNKKEVRFSDESAVQGAVAEACKEAILGSSAIPDAGDNVDLYGKNVERDSYTGPAGRFSEGMAPYGKKPDDDSRPDTRKADEGRQVDIKEFLAGKREAVVIEEEEPTEEVRLRVKEVSDGFGDPDIYPPAVPPFDLADLRLKGIIFDTYIVTEDGSNCYLFDQHAAHERVNYENFVDAFFSGERLSQILLMPFTFDVHPELAEDPDRWTLPLSKMGYSLEPFGETTFIVREIPGFTTLGEAEEFIKAYTEAFLDGIQLDDRVVIDKLITKACKSSIKAGDSISPEEAKALLESLSRCKNPFSCPHGRPTFVRLTKYDLERMFKRIQ